MKQIPLSQGLFAMVDDEDYEWLSKWKWCAHKNPNGKWYALRRDKGSGKRGHIFMHREIVNAPVGKYTDHKNQSETLNNQRYNLRICTKSQNAANIGITKKNSSGYKGVYFNKRAKKWQAYITVLGQSIYLNLFEDIIDAAKAYDKAALRYFGEFAYTNFREEK